LEQVTLPKRKEGPEDWSSTEDYGRCLNDRGEGTDKCEQFQPKLNDALNCSTCDCSKYLHERHPQKLPPPAPKPVKEKKQKPKKQPKMKRPGVGESDLDSHDSQEPDNMSASTTSTSSTHSRKWIPFDGAYIAEVGEARLADLNDRLAVMKKRTDVSNEEVKKESDAREFEFVCLGLGCGKTFSAYISESQPNVRCPFCHVIHLVTPEGKAVYVFLVGKRSVRCAHCQQPASIHFDSDQTSYRCEKCDVTMMLRLRGKIATPVADPALTPVKSASPSLFCCLLKKKTNNPG